MLTGQTFPRGVVGRSRRHVLLFFDYFTLQGTDVRHSRCSYSGPMLEISREFVV